MRARHGLRLLVSSAGLICALTGLALTRPAQAAPPAGAEAAAVDQANCVYDQLSDPDALAMVDTYLRQDAARKPDVETSLRAAYKICAAKYGWKADRSELAAEIALQGAVIDVVIQNMVDDGLSQAGALLQIWNGLTEDDVGRLLEDNWQTDASLAGRLRTALVDGGVPDRGGMLKNGVIVLVAASREAAAMDRWLHGERP